MLERHGIVPQTVCEIGCGAGEILRSLSTHLEPSAKFFGYEISPNAYKICSQKANEKFTFRLANLLDDEKAYFDLVMAMDVFEHVEDYFGFLRKLRARGQYKIFHIPLDMSAQEVLRGKPMDARKSVGHIHYFSKDTALATLEDCGYTVLDQFYTSGRTDLGGLGWKSHLMKIPRQALYRMNPDAAARVLGGYSLLVLAR
jgi:cyclopropane fatty-acyl-phospholipid synthase-like methyltransferase